MLAPKNEQSCDGVHAPTTHAVHENSSINPVVASHAVFDDSLNVTRSFEAEAFLHLLFSLLVHQALRFGSKQELIRNIVRAMSRRWC